MSQFAAAGAILDELMLANAAKRGIHWEEGWILTANIVQSPIRKMMFMLTFVSDM